MSSVPPIDLVQALSENIAWLRRLARALVGESAADDLVQDTMEVALRRPPAIDRPIRPWLATVLKNAAKMRRRSSNRRDKREAFALPTADPNPPDTSLAKLETQRRIVQAVLSLEEPYRQTVVLRYVDDLTAAEIARRLEVPAATIRSRLKRGLEMLRSDLERQGDGPNWRLALVPFIAPTQAVSPTTPILLGGLIMKLGIATAVAIATVLAIATVTNSASDLSQSKAGSDVDHSVDQEPRADHEAIANPVPTEDSRPRRFRGSDERQRFAKALALARLGTGERPTKTYDFSGVRVPQRPTASKGKELPGKLDKDYIRARIAEIIPLVRECYEIALANDSALSGAVTVDFVIDAEQEVGGYVREAVIAEDSDLQDPVLSECVTETILSVEFMPPEGGGVVRVRYPFVLQHDSQ